MGQGARVGIGLGACGIGFAVVAFLLEQADMRLPVWSQVLLWWLAISLFVGAALLCISGPVCRFTKSFPKIGKVFYGVIPPLIALPITAFIVYLLLYNPSFVHNGGFEKANLAGWTRDTHGKGTVVFRAEEDKDEYCEGSFSARIAYETMPVSGKSGTLSQRVEGLSRNMPYTVVFWVKIDRFAPGAAFLSVDPAWNKRLDIVMMGGQWRKHVDVFTTANGTFELSFVVLAPAKFWVDGVALYKGDKRGKRLGKDRCPD